MKNLINPTASKKGKKMHGKQKIKRHNFTENINDINFAIII